MLFRSLFGVTTSFIEGELVVEVWIGDGKFGIDTGSRVGVRGTSLSSSENRRMMDSGESVAWGGGRAKLMLPSGGEEIERGMSVDSLASRRLSRNAENVDAAGFDFVRADLFQKRLPKYELTERSRIGAS